MRYLALIILICLIGNCSFGQMPNWKVKPIDLPAAISNLNIDSLGFMWMSSEANLYRFDGNELELKFSFDDETIISVRNKNGLFYIGTIYGRLLEINPYKNSFSVIYESEDYNPITDVYFIDKHNFILLSYGVGVQLSIDGIISHLTSDKGLLSNELYEIEEFNDKFYISSDQGLQIITIQNSDFQLSKIVERDGISDLVTTQLKRSGDKLWYSDYDSHIGSIDSDGNIKNYAIKLKGKIKDIISRGDVIYVLNDKGIQKFSKEKWEIKYIGKENISAKLIQLDDEDNLWIIDNKNNIAVGNLRFQKIDLDIDDIRAVAKLEDKLFVGNENGLYLYYNNTKTKINSQNITYLSRYNEYLLVGTFSDGIMVYNSNNRLIDALDRWSNIPNESILSIYEYKGYIYVSSLSGVMKMQLSKGHLERIQSLNSIIGQTYVYCIFADQMNMYFGTDRNGLVKWNSINDKIEKLERFSNGEKIGSVYSITSDEESNIWFTSAEKGIGKLNSNSIEYLDAIGNLKDEFTSIDNLKDGSLLLIRSSSLGLLQSKDHHFMYFDDELGFKEETAFLNTTTQDDDNTYFVNGKSIYTYQAQGSMKIHPEIIIDEVIVNLSSADGQNIFDENENNIAIKYKGSWLTDPAKLSYQYKLEGFDENWRETKDDQVAFPKLIPGQYNFVVRAAENGIFSNEPEASFSFKINKHFYNYWHVRLLFACILFALLFRWRKHYENQKKEKLSLEKTIVENQLINLKNQLNPHFLFNSFNTLISLIEEDNERSIAFVERMTFFYRDILELGEDSMVNLEKEKNMLEHYVEILSERFNNQIIIDSQFDDPSNYEIPPMTLQLLVENAVKHNVVSSKQPLHIKIFQNGENLTVWNRINLLINNPMGTNTGLKNTKKRFELVNLAIPIITSTDEYFEVKLKLKRR